MPPTIIHSAPPLDTFTPLDDHQSQTPAVFYGAKPILHYRAVGARALVSKDHLSKLPIFSQTPREEVPSEAEAEAEAEGQKSTTTTEVIDVYISSENLTLFNNATSTGVSIPYPAISLHAIQTLDDPENSSQQVQGLYMQLELSDPYSVSEDEEPETLELTIILAVPSGGIQQLFEAVSNCSNLNPDPTEEDEEMEDADSDSRIVFEGSVGYEGISGVPGIRQGVADGGLPPPFPGSGGWITAENVSEFFDEEGNWIGEGNGLGGGAGRIRTRDEIEANFVNGHGEHESDENKRPRTD